jgi:hypothetical protein
MRRIIEDKMVNLQESLSNRKGIFLKNGRPTKGGGGLI